MEHNQLEEGQVVLCTVEKIVGTTVFVRIQDNGEGTITTSEIAPGRIRNLRVYVIPGKKIVCKVLSMKGDRINLSLRRVKQNEKKELLDKIAKEKSYRAILKTAVGKDSDEIINRITENNTLLEFFEQAKQNPKILTEYLNKEQTEKILKILESKKEKEKEIKQIFRLSSKAENGIKIVKEIINSACKNSKCDVSYIAAGKYRIIIAGENFKELKMQISSILQEIERQAKKQDCEFELEKSKH